MQACFKKLSSYPQQVADGCEMFNQNEKYEKISVCVSFDAITLERPK